MRERETSKTANSYAVDNAVGTSVGVNHDGRVLRSKGDTGQINEALCKVLAHNICVLVQATHELGIVPVFLMPALAATSDIR